MRRYAFMTVEVLISLVIISMGVLMAMSALKTMHATSSKESSYEDLTIALMSIKDTLSGIDFEKTKHFVGTINSWNYTISSQQIVARRTYVYDESVDIAGNKGAFELDLYKITLSLEKEQFKKKYIFYQTQSKKIFTQNDNEI